MPLKAKGIHIPEDVVHLIFEEILFQGDRSSFHAAALLSSTFLSVAQLHLYRSCELDIGKPTSIRNFIILLDIIESRPYIGGFINKLTIVDTPQAEKKSARHRFEVVTEKTHLSPQSCDHRYRIYQNFIDIFILNKHNILPRLCRVLPSLTQLEFSFQYGRLDWLTLHAEVRRALKILFSLKHLDIARLNGLINLPSSISADLFSFGEVEFKNSHFSPLTHLGFHNGITYLRRGGNNRMRRLYMELGHGWTNFEHSVRHWQRHQVADPQVDAVHISISGWHGSGDAAAVFGILGRSIKKLSISTTELGLTFVQHQPPGNPFTNPSTYAIQLPRMKQHTIGECFATEECDLVTTPTQQHFRTPHSHNWFLRLMSPLRPCFHVQSFQMLHSIKFEISHWRSAMETEANGELFWAISWLAELPLERAENIKTLEINVRVGTDLCLDNAAAMHELVGYRGWRLLDLIVGHGNWRSLEQVMIRTRSRTTCLFAVEDKFQVLMNQLKESMFLLLNARGIVDATYESLESKLPG